MSLNNFEMLASQARQLDDGIEKLTTIWKLPHVLVGRFTECTSETNAHMEALRNTISDTQSGIEEILRDTEEFKVQDSVTIEEFMKNAKSEYETLKDQCDQLESVLAEYGYQSVQDNSLDPTSKNDSESSNQSSAEGVENSEVEFTPSLSWKSKGKQNVSQQVFNDSCLSQTFITPVINGSASLAQNSSITHKEYVCTPVRERPQEPIYSKHFYNILKK